MWEAKKDFLLCGNKQELDNILLTGEKKKVVVILLKHLKAFFNTCYRKKQGDIINILVDNQLF